MKMLQRILNKIARWVFRPRIKLVPEKASEIRLGTVYGGKTFMDRKYLHGGIVISAGLGEDASFDVEFSARYGGKVIIVDPTPRSIQYFEKLKSRIGQSAECAYGASGYLPVESYDLSAVRADDLVLVKKALWIEATKLRFFLPKNVEHVSHSIVNFQNDHRNDTAFIEVESITLKELMAAQNITSIDLLKLDIEGAEVDVLVDMLQSKIYPKQILVEFDELSNPSAVVRRKYEAVYDQLLSSGYVCRAWDGYADYCFELLKIPSDLESKSA